MHYLDNAATTPIKSEVADAIAHALRNSWANPSALYVPGAEAEEKIHAARRVLATALGHKGELDTKRPEILFTASGTEANNLALLGAARARRGWGNHIVTTGYEHSSVRNVIAHLAQKEGFEVTVIHPAKSGAVYAEELVQAVHSKTVLACAMHLNNETGALLDVAGIAQAVKERNPRTAVHVDMIQSFCKVPLDIAASQIDTAALSAHKLGGPKGIGALYLRKGLSLEPVLFGGGQEGGVRPGTENLPYIVGFAKAVELMFEHQTEDTINIRMLNLQLMAALATLDGIRMNSPEHAWPGIINFSLPEGFQSQVMLGHLEREKSVFLSGGSSCDRGKPSATLTAMGLPKEQVTAALRVGLSGQNTPEDIDALLAGLRSGLAGLARRQ